MVTFIMSWLLNLVGGVISRESSWIVVVLIGVVTFHLMRQWMRVRQLPPGPYPLPIVGNLLAFRVKKSVTDIMLDFAKQYGGIFTLWMGGKPFVMVTDWELTKEGLITKRTDFMSRPNDIRSFNHLRQEVVGIAFEPGDRNWEVSRKVGSGAIRKFAESEKLAYIVKKGTEELIDKMLNHKGNPFDPISDLQIMTTNVLSDTAFGIDCLNYEDYAKILKCTTTIQELGGNTPGDFSFFLLLIYYARDQLVKNKARELKNILTSKYIENKKTFQKGVIRSFVDAVITARCEAEEEDSDAKDYLDDEHLIKIIGVLFLAGSETTASTLKWVILFLGYFQDIQRKIKDEIQKRIGSRMAVQSDRLRCPYTWAFLSESLRYRTVFGLGVPHLTTVNTELGGHRIMKGTIVSFVSEAIHSDNSVWEQADQFKPERFLNSDGSYNHDTRKGFLAFGEGKRNCVGEKLARNDLFLFVVNLLQHVDIHLEPGQSKNILYPEISVAFTTPKKYNVIVVSPK